MIVLLGFLLFGLCATVPVLAVEKPAVTIAPFQGNRQAAISYTFDDGLRDQLELAAPMLEACGFRGTFFIVPSLVPDTKKEAAAKKPGQMGGISWPELRDLAERGHEIANHTWSHKNQLKLDDAGCREEILKASDLIEKKLGKPPLTLAFPGNAQDDRTRALALESNVAVRRTQQGFGKPEFTTAQANKWADRVVAAREWGVVMIHGIVAGYDAFSGPDVLRDHLKYVQGLTDKVWVGTFAEVARYRREREATTLSLEYRKGGVICSMKSSLDPKIYTVPLTLVVKVLGAREAEATGVVSGEKSTVRILPEGIFVDWAPTDGPVNVSWR